MTEVYLVPSYHGPSVARDLDAVPYSRPGTVLVMHSVVKLGCSSMAILARLRKVVIDVQWSVIRHCRRKLVERV